MHFECVLRYGDRIMKTSHVDEWAMCRWFYHVTEMLKLSVVDSSLDPG